MKINTKLKLFDITLKYGDKEIQPNGKVGVKVELKDDPIKEPKVVHFGENAEVLDATASEDGSVVSFETDGFSVYAIVGTSTTVQYLTADGKTLNVSVTFDPREELPAGAKLEVSEVTYEDDPGAYAQRNERLAEALSEQYGNVAITDVRYLNISVVLPDKADEEYEPVYPVEVKISYTEPIDTTNPGEYEDYNDGSTKVDPDIGNHIVGVHYTEDGAEFLETVDESTNTGVSETVTKTDSLRIRMGSRSTILPISMNIKS